jgi:small subunit ribosomal protein S6
MYIVKPELDDEAVQQEIEKVGQMIQNNGGEVAKVTPWGKRRLAYAVGPNHEGHYVVTEFNLPQDRVREVDRLLKISDTVFRHLLVRQESIKDGGRGSNAARSPEPAGRPEGVSS